MENVTNSMNLPDREKCNYYNRTRNRLLITAYEGIPENLLLNVLGCLILVIFFAFMRKRAWDYGRLALVNKDYEKWSRIFYGTTDENSESNIEDGNSTTTLDNSMPVDRGLFSWFLTIIQLRDEKILRKCGYDAVQYLSFQRHIMVLMAIITAVSLGVVLPINFAGEQEGDERSFGHTTVSNLRADSPWLWVHVTIAMLYFPLTIFIMRRFSVNLKLEENGECWSRTLMITNIPRRNSHINDLDKHFKEAYPECDVENIQLAYDVNKANELDRNMNTAVQAKQYCENYLKTVGERLTVQPHTCGYICIGCGFCTSNNLDAIDYYSGEESRLKAELEAEKESAKRRPLGIAFVTMTTIHAARLIYQDHIYKLSKCGRHNPPTSSVSGLLQPYRWRVTFAPPPDDIFWENLTEPSHNRYCKIVLTNSFLIIILFFLTTPVIVLNVMDTLKLREIEKASPILSEFMPTLLLWTFAALLPVIVIRSDQWLSHWTRSKRNHSIMRKTFVFLLFMGLILPSFGLTSAQAFLEFAFQAGIQTYRWQCVFLPDKGAFFVNYVVTSALIGTSLELIRFPELFMYALRLALSRSKAESHSARRLILWEFPFGVQYAWMLLIFSIVTVYSIACPLITPFGLLYMVTKHFVDRYNIYFAYGKSKISKRIHSTAINCVMVSIVLLQVSFTSLSMVRHGLHDITIFALVGLVVTLTFTLSQCFFRHCTAWSPIQYQARNPCTVQPSPARRRDHSHDSDYIPEVLRPSLRSTAETSLITLTLNGSGTALNDLEIELKHNVKQFLYNKIMFHFYFHCF
ncbi:10TM putative phosphate transporter, cytosolic domain,Calcium-dependent channel, 7TM region, putative [Cinara cedri]|uniref:10TM putative phosphate transporter, cytosolic domain,Calcium-dependent channel, 7TM region, putative n=1 Tax=Cinara cedri TaxID=506608 RepID=A0A5E4MEJ1_9HEMI|nr:10TM putative phosphate transporter, cytosolic domain,Calcium-dependent channel, 7TM region, putative [Cinara cedri]